MSTTRTAGSRYYVRFGVSLAAYGVTLVAGILWLRALGEASPWRWLAMALPIPALVAIIWAVTRYVLEADELQSRIQLQAMSIGFAGGSLLTFSYGLMQVVGAPDVSWMLVWPVYAACWLLGLVVARRQY